MRRQAAGPWVHIAALGAILSPAGAPFFAAVIPDGAPELPVLSREVPAGKGDTTPSECAGTPVARAIDGDPSDWIGEPARYGGVGIYSCGEYIYQDHLFDAYGADAGDDAERLSLIAPATEADPRAYRLDPAVEYAQGELGLPEFPPFDGQQAYGDAGHQDHADIAEVRVAADGDDVWLLVRTTTMTADQKPAILVLADTKAGSLGSVPFGSGLTTEVADVAVLITDASCIINGAVGTCDVAMNPDGYTNAVEVRIPRDAIESAGGVLNLALAAGTVTGSSVSLANVAFRFDEPVRIFWEKQQALALGAGSIDEFFTGIDVTSGASEDYVPGPGYHDRIFLSDPKIADERGDRGIYQHYGIYLPTKYFEEPGPAPLQFWLHFRGGRAHTVATVVPRTMQQFGEDVGTIVVSPSGRGTSRWYVGKGHADFLEVWDDVHETFEIDANRVYVTGHSMGGWGSYLMTVLYPDRFAAGMPVAGPVTQGAWTGLDFEGCDELAYEDGDVNTPCYVSVNGGRGRDQHTRRMLENLRNVPLAIFQGAIDELVFVTGVTRQVEQLALLGYPHRYYLFPTYEHYSHPIVDEWVEGVAYLHKFVRDPNPRHVVYRRDVAFESAVEEVQSDGVALEFDFDSAYWMSGLEIAEGRDFARFDGTSLALPGQQEVPLPEAGGPTALGQTGPFVMTGLARNDVLPPLETANGFQATLEGANEVELDLVRMAIQSNETINGTVANDVALTMKLRGAWTEAPTVSGAPSSFGGGLLTLQIPAGGAALVIQP